MKKARKVEETQIVPIKDLMEAARSIYGPPDKPAPTAAEKALRTATWARTMTKVIVSRNNKQPPIWHVINFLGKGGQESSGIIDLMAIRKDHKGEGGLPKGDGFEIILIQVKGGSARNPSPEDLQRLKAVQARYGAKAVVLSSWKKGSEAKLRVLSDAGWGDPVEPDLIFGARKTKSKAATKGGKKNSSAPASDRSAAAKAAWQTRRKASKS